MSSGSAPRPPKGTKAPAPAPKGPPFDEKKQLAMAKALRAKKKPAPLMHDDDSNEKE